MKVLKRSGETEDVSFDKVLQRMRNLCTGFGKPDLEVDIYDISQKVCARIYNNVATSELDELAAQICSSLIVNHPDYGDLASRIIVSNHHKNTSPSFTETITILYTNKDVDGEPCPLVSDELYEIALKHKEKLNSYLDYTRDFEFDYFGFKTLERAYLLKVNGVTVERPQHMFMRVALGIHANDVKDALQMYDLMSKKFYIHATPTLFNSGTKRPQLSSCFLLSSSDSIEGIYDTLKECANISKYAGGIGMHIHSIRAKGSKIRGTNGNSTGIVPMLRVFNNTARYVNQCFTPDVTVFSKNGVVRMDEVCVGDQLVTIDGTFKPVNSVSIKHVDKDILEVRTKYSMEPIKVTKEHEMYVLKSCDVLTGQNKLITGNITPQYVPASEITTNDLVGYPIPTTVDDILEDAEFCRFYGTMIKYGYISTGNVNKYTIECDDKDTLDFVQKYLNKNSIAYSIKDSSIHWSDDVISFGDIYNQNGVKHIHQRMLNLPHDKMKSLVKGLVHTTNNDTVHFTFEHDSKDVVASVRYILLRLGVLTYGEASTLHIPKHPNVQFLSQSEYYGNVFAFFEHENIIWSRISEINEINYSGPVYDFNMMDNHNYTVANFGLVHNSGKRNGSIAVYLEPWHADIEGFLDLRKPHGNEEERTRDLFLALWIPDLFMKRVQENGMWSLMCPDECKGLPDTYGAEFEALYTKYESEGKFVKQVPAQKVWFKILESQIESGQPYMLYKDACNEKSNQKNLGVIKSSNLCTEIVEYTSDEETAVCNLASIALPSFVKQDENGVPYVDHKHLHEVTKIITKNLNKVIDVTFYPVAKARTSNLRHRPIGIGVQGLADMFVLMNAAFDSEEAIAINRDVFETIYHASLEASMEIAKKRHQYSMELRTLGNDNDARWSEIHTYLKLNEFDPKPMTASFPGAYSSFEGSPTSKGVFQFDMWNVTPSSRYDWEALKQDVMTYGVRNSLLLAPMPTASTSQILGFNECIEPFTSNMYKRKTLAGEFIVINKYLIKELIRLGVWNKELKDQIIIHDGSIQNIPQIPDKIKELFKTVWELKQKTMIDMAADRAAYICQSQSLNLFMEDPDFKKLSSMHFYSWKKGLKTGIYYLRSKAKAQAQKFTIDPSLNKLTNLKPSNKTVVCTDEVCTVCSA